MHTGVGGLDHDDDNGGGGFGDDIKNGDDDDDAQRGRLDHSANSGL